MKNSVILPSLSWLKKTVFNKRFLGFRFLGFMVFRFLICTKTEHESTTQKQMVYLNTVS